MPLPDERPPQTEPTPENQPQRKASPRPSSNQAELPMSTNQSLTSRRRIRSLAFLAQMLFSLLGFAVCIFAIVAIWTAWSRGKSSIESVTARLDPGIQQLSRTLTSTSASLEQIHTDVAIVPEDSSSLDVGSSRHQIVTSYFRTVLQRLRQFRDTVRLAVDLAARLPDSWFPGEAVAMANRLKALAEKLSTEVDTLGLALQDDKSPSETELVDLAKRMMVTIEHCRETLDQSQTELTTWRDRLPQRITAGMRWLMWIAVALTLILAWLAYGQLALLGNSWIQWRKPV